MKATHTTGEWTTMSDGKTTSVFSGQDTTPIFTITHNEDGYSQTEANIKLIASAPFMLQTLIDMVAMESTPDHIKKYANDAIKQATE